MGLGNTGGNSTFVTIVNGKFTIRLQEGDNNPDAVERVLGERSPRAGETIRELQFNHLDGNIVSGEMKEGKYGVDMVFKIVDKGEVLDLQIGLNSSFFGQIAKRLPNADPSNWFDFFVGKDSDSGKPFIYFKQGGEVVKMEHTRDHPNGMPPWGKKMDKGKEVDDPSAQENFLYEVAKTFLARIDGKVVPKAQAEAAPEVPAPAADDEDDIPF
jgi:hypothetical protein